MQVIKTTFTLPGHTVDELSKISKELGIKKSHIVIEALNQYFDTLDLALAMRRSNEIKEGKVKTISFEKIKREIGF